MTPSNNRWKTKGKISVTKLCYHTPAFAGRMPQKIDYREAGVCLFFHMTPGGFRYIALKKAAIVRVLTDQ